MKGLRIPLQRTFPPKLAYEDLRRRASHALEKCGYEANKKARMTAEALSLLIESNNPIFRMIRPRPKLVHRNKAWKIALEFCIDYLREFKLIQCEKCVMLELKCVGEHKSTGFFSKNRRSEYLSKIVKDAAFYRKSFAGRLAEFRKQQALMPPPKPVSNHVPTKNSSELSRSFGTLPSSVPPSRDGDRRRHRRNKAANKPKSNNVSQTSISTKHSTSRSRIESSLESIKSHSRESRKKETHSKETHKKKARSERPSYTSYDLGYYYTEDYEESSSYWYYSDTEWESGEESYEESYLDDWDPTYSHT